MKILVINSGSSSLKYKLFDITGKNEQELGGGIVENIGNNNSTVKFKVNKTEKKIKTKIFHHQQAIDFIINEVLTNKKNQGLLESMDEIEAVGHRVVHGGEKFKESVIITDKVIKSIEKFSRYAPLHNPANLNGICSCIRTLESKPQVAAFDTAFHQTIPDYAYLYPLPLNYYKDEGFRRYGFHGTSHQYISNKASEVLKLKKYKFITCHLGNGASISAVKDGRSIDTSMGFTPLEGLMMGTRTGDMDPALVLALLEHHSAKQVDKILNKESGLLGISGLTNDMRILMSEVKKGGKKGKLCKLAIDMYVHRIKKYIGSYLALLNGADAIIFTAGVGENCPWIRELILSHMDFLGVKLSPAQNNQGKQVISSPASKIKVLIIPTEEELMIARDTYKLIK